MDMQERMHERSLYDMCCSDYPIIRTALKHPHSTDIMWTAQCMSCGATAAVEAKDLPILNIVWNKMIRGVK